MVSNITLHLIHFLKYHKKNLFILYHLKGLFIIYLKMNNLFIRQRNIFNHNKHIMIK